MPTPNFRSPSLFTPSVVRSLNGDLDGNDSYYGTTYLAQLQGATVGHSSSFRYDPIGSGLKSTQQLNVDWSEFQNHTFFNSARVKVNSTFVKLFDNYPFDGSQSEYELFIDGLTGYEKYVFDQFPKYKGYLFFSGSTYVSTKDLRGADYPTLTRTATGESGLNPGPVNSMTVEFQLYLPPVSSSNQVVLQKVTGSQGFGIQLFATGSTNQCGISMTAMSGSSVISTDQALLTKGQFNHVAFIWNRTPGVSRIFTYVNQTLVASSSAVEIDNMACDAAMLYIGSGSIVNGFTPTTTMSGAMDELRIWHTVRTPEQRAEFSTKNVFADPDTLKLYYKFNECLNNDDVLVIDHSGNGFHGNISPWALANGVRNIPTGSIAGPSPLINERDELNPVLFSHVDEVVTLQETLLTNAADYDHSNPNLITKLFPPHFFLEGQEQDGLDSIEGDITETYQSDGVGQAQVGETQVLLGLMWIWAKFFDEIKLYQDAFANTIHVDYANADTVPDQFLQVLADRYGIQLPSLFTGTSIQQFINAENLDTSYNVGQYSLYYIQNQLWRRLLVNINDILSSKGTVHSIKAFIRTLGIDPDNNFHIREYGGPTKRALKVSREQRSEVATLLDFTGGGYSASPYLFGPRVEPGFPEAAGTINDQLYTSGSWTVEGTYKFVRPAFDQQSVFRLQTTGSYGINTLFNIVAVSGSGLVAYGRPNSHPLAPVLSMSLDGFDMLDGQLWNVSFGRTRGDAINVVTSSYFLRAAKQSFGNIAELYETSSFFDDNTVSHLSNSLQALDTKTNTSGAMLVIGSGTLCSATVDKRHLFDGTTNFDGNVGQVRFWSKDLSLTEWKEHVRNFKSIGVVKPEVNFNFITNTSGSFERLRLDVSMDQQVQKTDGSGSIQLFDFSQNNLHMTGSGFVVTSSVFVPQTFYYGFISPRFDESATNNKIRVRSFLNFDNVLNDEDQYAQVAPIYDIDKFEAPQDNTRFGIDFSVVDTLNQDIVNMFATLDELDNAIGAPELMFGGDYPTLDYLKNIYFNRLTDKIQLKTFFEFYKWFDSNIGSFISQLVPRKTAYLGTNYVVESHMLERPRFEYQSADIYLGDSNRHAQKDTILLSYYEGVIGKY